MDDIELIYPLGYVNSKEFMGYPIVDYFEGDPIIKIGEERFRVMWKDEFSPKPVLVSQQYFYKLRC